MANLIQNGSCQSETRHEQSSTRSRRALTPVLSTSTTWAIVGCNDIIVEQISRPDAGRHYPTCVEGGRACPPEDCGGPPGYEELRRVISNPRHRDYRRMMVWLGGQLDPEAFDLQAVNDELHWIRIGRSFPRI